MTRWHEGAADDADRSAPRSAWLTRRRALGALVAGAAGTAALAWSHEGPPSPTHLRVAGGPPASSHHRQAQLLARVLVQQGVVASASALTTRGAADNLELVRAGRAEVAITLTDHLVRSPWRPVALARTHESSLHVLVRDRSPYRSLRDLRGQVVSIGAPGSGSASTAQALLDASGVGSPFDGTRTWRDLDDSAVALVGGRLEALFWWGGLPPAQLLSLHRTFPLRMLDVADVYEQVERTQSGAYQLVLVPAGVYDDQGPVTTLGTANLLVCRSDLDDRVCRGVVDAGIDLAAALVPQPADGIQYLSRAALPDTAPIPLHPAASARYVERYG